MADALLIVLLVIAGYLLGSISTAIVVCRALRRPDPRSGGSRNPGATNVLRIAGRDAAALTLVGDMLKGVLAVMLARWLAEDPLVWILAGCGAFLGHLYPLYFRFRGGKGVATALGVLLAAIPVAGGLTILSWLAGYAASRVSSIGAITAFVLAPVWVAVVSGSAAMTGLVTAMAVLLIWCHRSNIRQLLQRGHS